MFVSCVPDLLRPAEMTNPEVLVDLMMVCYMALSFFLRYEILKVN
jgi:hypothetical protein